MGKKPEKQGASHLFSEALVSRQSIAQQRKTEEELAFFPPNCFTAASLLFFSSQYFLRRLVLRLPQ